MPSVGETFQALGKQLDFQSPQAALKTVMALGSGNNVPSTKVRMSFAMSIRARIGKDTLTIGNIQEIGLTHSVEVEPIWEINPLSIGIPVQQVVQNMQTRGIRLVRYQLYHSTIGQAMNLSGADNEMVLLSSQAIPVSLRLQFQPPIAPNVVGAFLKPATVTYEYTGCVFTEIGETMSMSGDLTHKANASLIYRNAYRLS